MGLWSSAPAQGKGNTEEVLKGLEIFSKLPDRQIKKLARLLLPRRYPKGEILIKKGDTGLGMFLIDSGRVEVFDTREGLPITLATLGAGKCVGEMSLMDERPRSANVQAIEDTDCLLLTRDSFNGLTRRDPEILWGIVPLLVERLRHADVRLTELADSRTSSALGREAPVSPPASVVVSVQEPESRAVPVATAAPAGPIQREHAPLRDAEDEEDAEEREKKEGHGLLASLVQLSTASTIFWSAAFLLGTQEAFRMVWSRQPIVESLGKSEDTVSSLVANFEGHMSSESKRLFQAFQDLMSSVAAVFQK